MGRTSSVFAQVSRVNKFISSRSQGGSSNKRDELRVKETETERERRRRTERAINGFNIVG